MTTRNLTIAFVTVLGLTALAAIWYSLGMPGVGRPVTDENSYRNHRYEYVFLYPHTLAIHEYSPRYVTVAKEEEELVNYVALTVAAAEKGTSYASFDAFARSQLSLLCAADIERAELSCTGEVAREEGVNRRGITYALYTTTLTIQDRTTGSIETMTFGPVYVYDVSEDPFTEGFSALMIYTPVTTTLLGVADEGVLETVTQSLTFTNREATSKPTE